MKKKYWYFAITLLILAGLVTALFMMPKKAAAPVAITGQNPSPQTSQRDQNNTSEPTFDKAKYSTTDPASIWVIVDKKLPLPAGYKPTDLTIPNVKLRLNNGEEQMQISSKLSDPLNKMFAAAKAENIILVFGSGYRSEILQKQFYDQYVAQSGQAAADKFSARPRRAESPTAS